MEQGHDNRDHREYEDLLAGAALGTLTADEHAALVAHLRQCPSCRSTLAGLFAAAEVLPGSVEEREPSAGLRDRLRAQVERDIHAHGQEADVPFPSAAGPAQPSRDRIPPQPTPVPTTTRQRRIPVPVFRAIAVAAMLIAGLIGGIVIDRLVFDEESSGPTESIALTYPTGLNLEQASLAWMPGQDVLRFSAPELPAPPEGHIYQVWLIAGDTPEPAGVVNSATGNYATTADPDRYRALAITVEPAPLGSPGPTSDPIIVASLNGQDSSAS